MSLPGNFSNLRCALPALLTCLLISPSPVLAETGQSDEALLGQYEQVVLGKPAVSGSNQDRLRALETKLFGKPRKGDYSQRLTEVGKTLGPESAPPSPEPPASAAQADAPKEGRVSVSTVNSEPNDVNELLKQGIKQYSDGQLVDARKSFIRVMELDPRNSHAMFNLAAIDERYGNLDGALHKYELAESFDRNDPEIRHAVDSLRRQMTASRSQVVPSQQMYRGNVQQQNLVGQANQNALTGRAEQVNLQAMQDYQASLQQGTVDQRKQSPVLRGLAVGSGIALPALIGSVAGGGFRIPIRRSPITGSGFQVPIFRSGPSLIGGASRTVSTAGGLASFGMSGARMMAGLGILHCPMCRILGR